MILEMLVVEAIIIAVREEVKRLNVMGMKKSGRRRRGVGVERVVNRSSALHQSGLRLQLFLVVVGFACL